VDGVDGQFDAKFIAFVVAEEYLGRFDSAMTHCARRFSTLKAGGK
jgi:hypothetical protein